MPTRSKSSRSSLLFADKIEPKRDDKVLRGLKALQRNPEHPARDLAAAARRRETLPAEKLEGSRHTKLQQEILEGTTKDRRKVSRPKIKPRHLR